MLTSPAADTGHVLSVLSSVVPAPPDMTLTFLPGPAWVHVQLTDTRTNRSVWWETGFRLTEIVPTHRTIPYASLTALLLDQVAELADDLRLLRATPEEHWPELRWLYHTPGYAEQALELARATRAASSAAAPSPPTPG